MSRSMFWSRAGCIKTNRVEIAIEMGTNQNNGVGLVSYI